MSFSDSQTRLILRNLLIPHSATRARTAQKASRRHNLAQHSGVNPSLRQSAVGTLAVKLIPLRIQPLAWARV